MQYNFDEIIDRHGTDAIKIEVIEKEWKRTDLLPLWVAIWISVLLPVS